MVKRGSRNSTQHKARSGAKADPFVCSSAWRIVLQSHGRCKPGHLSNGKAKQYRKETFLGSFPYTHTPPPSASPYVRYPFHSPVQADKQVGVTTRFFTRKLLADFEIAWFVRNGALQEHAEPTGPSRRIRLALRPNRWRRTTPRTS
jgi:hypothetical protein